MIPREMIQNKGSPDTVANESQSQVDSKRGKGDGPSHIAEQLWGLAIPIDSVNPDPSNARKHDEKNLEAIKASLSRFGQRSPIIVQREGMTVRAGNGRLLAAKSLGWKQIAAVVVDESSIDAVAFAIADNRTAELATWDNETLAQLLDTMPKDVLGATGFSDKDLADLLDEIRPEVVEDEVPEPPVDPISKPGDLWLLGDHRLLCGDSTKAEDVARVLCGGAADTVTDPPYGIGYEYSDHDDSSQQKNEQLVRDVFRHAPGAKIWTPGLMNLAREISVFKEAKILVWHKGFAQAGNGLGGASTWEPVLCVGVKSGRLPNDYLHFGTDREPGLREKHSCPKPVKLFSHLIEHLTGRGIYEPFCGSGTTLIAAEQLGRKCYGIEISPAYCDVIVQRWEKLTGKKAVLESR